MNDGREAGPEAAELRFLHQPDDVAVRVGGKIVGIEILADPERLTQLDLTIPGD